jgi:hypothetical protein
MATTTNYGWQTPDDTALVKDGASAIRTLGSSVDTTTKALNPSTTLGDIEYRSATANTNTRLGIGSNGQYLTITGGVPAWGGISAGGMTLISTTTLTGASVTLSSIPQTYNDLHLVIRNFRPATDDKNIQARFNADSGANRHRTIDLNSIVNPTTFNSNLCELTVYNDNSISTGLTMVRFYDYTNSTTWKFAKSESITVDPNTTTSLGPSNRFVVYNQTPAITSLSLFPNVGNFTSGTALLYGVK